MYRYLDQHGRTAQLADDAELRGAIVDGRVKPGTPFAAADERWTTASKHPAYQRNRATGQGQFLPSLFAGRPGWRKFARVAGPVLALALGIYARRDDFGGGERDKLIEASSALAEGQAVPAALLSSPPRRQSDKVIWVAMSAAHDAEQQITAAELRHGVLDTPDGWLEPHYLQQPSAYPHIARYFDAKQRFNLMYRDSLIPITERALRRRAAEAKLKDKSVEALIADTRNTSGQMTAYYDAEFQWAREARRLHGLLVVAERGGITVRDDQVHFGLTHMKKRYDSNMQRLLQAEARLDSLESQIRKESVTVTR